MLNKLVFKIGAFLRNPSLFKFYNDLIKSDYSSIEELKIIQENKFKILVDYAFNYSPYYKSFFEKNNINRNDIKSLEDISIFPILNKNDLLLNSSDIRSEYK